MYFINTNFDWSWSHWKERKPNENQHQWNKFKASRELHLPRRDHIPKRSCIIEDIKSRIRKAQGAVQRLQPIWKAENIQQDTKVELLQSPSALNPPLRGRNLDPEKEDENRLLVFEIMCLRKIMRVSCLDKIRNTKIHSHFALTTLSLTESLKKGCGSLDTSKECHKIDTPNSSRRPDWKAEDQRVDLPKDGWTA